ncbi:hypothetical protein BBK14_33370 [Parafrankia soli]|uniref:Uncharacterized protein n=1 Tax=Parafrankia soli TaxID=2599596 RepID=A0A1S1QU07_9ACTN|nr:hypothetical protein BBK14_33370 [Parafrankia soli]
MSPPSSKSLYWEMTLLIGPGRTQLIVGGVTAGSDPPPGPMTTTVTETSAHPLAGTRTSPGAVTVAPLSPRSSYHWAGTAESGAVIVTIIASVADAAETTGDSGTRATSDATA